MSPQKKGPAEAATSPSHGSNNPQEGNAVNRQHDITAPAVPAMPDFRQAFLDLDDLISAVRRPVRTLDFLISSFDERDLGAKDGRRICREELDAFYDMSFIAREAVIALEARWKETYDALCAHDHHPCRSHPEQSVALNDPLLALVQAYEEGVKEFDRSARELSDEEASELAGRTYEPHLHSLRSLHSPSATSIEGVEAALRMLNRHLSDVGMDDSLMTGLLPSICAYFDRKAA